MKLINIIINILDFIKMFIIIYCGTYLIMLMLIGAATAMCDDVLLITAIHTLILCCIVGLMIICMFIFHPK